MKAIVIEANGGSEQLKLQDRVLPELKPGEVLVDVVAAGVNFMDTGVRRGLYSQSPFPIVLGVEGAGRVAAVGPDVSELKVGDRVAWFMVRASYAQQVVAPAAALVPLPDGIDFETAAGMMMQGLTASHFVSETYAIKPGDIALVHSAAGGVGLMLTQMIKLLGGKVIGRVSSQDKVAIAKAAGADEMIVSSEGDFSAEVLALTHGEGVHVVYDGAGADTFYASLASLRLHGVLAYYGHTIKRLPPIDLLSLPKSVLVTYPSVMDHVSTREALLSRSNRLFQWVMEGKLKVQIGHRYPLAEAGRAHDDIESRRTTGKLLLLP